MYKRDNEEPTGLPLWSTGYQISTPSTFVSEFQSKDKFTERQSLKTNVWLCEMLANDEFVKRNQSDWLY
jgi:hypothetical protein